jgi:hypothetical protein
MGEADDDMEYEDTTEGETEDSEDIRDIFQQLLEGEDDEDEDDEYHGRRVLTCCDLSF